MKPFHRLAAILLSTFFFIQCSTQNHYGLEKIKAEPIAKDESPSKTLYATTQQDITFIDKTDKEVTLKSGTEIPLTLLHEVTSQDAESNSQVQFQVQTDIKVGGEIVIQRGSIAKGIVSHYEKSGAFGKPGSVTVQVSSVNAVDGTYVPLSGNSLSAEGSSNVALVIILLILLWWTIIGLLVMLINGGKGVIHSGSPVDATVTGNTQITIEK